MEDKVNSEPRMLVLYRRRKYTTLIFLHVNSVQFAGKESNGGCSGNVELRK